MEWLKEKMIEEINDYIYSTDDYRLENFISKCILRYMKETEKELMWYPTKIDKNNFVLDIAIEEM